MNASATNDCASHLVAVSTHEVLKLHVLGIKNIAMLPTLLVDVYTVFVLPFFRICLILMHIFCANCMLLRGSETNKYPK